MSPLEPGASWLCMLAGGCCSSVDAAVGVALSTAGGSSELSPLGSACSVMTAADGDTDASAGALERCCAHRD